MISYESAKYFESFAVENSYFYQKSFCQRRHSKLVEIESADENNFLRTQITGTHPQGR